MMTILLSELKQKQSFTLAYSNNIPIKTDLGQVKVIAAVDGKVVFKDPQTPLMKTSRANMARCLTRRGLTMYRDE